MVIEQLCKARALETRGWCVSAMANLSWQPEAQVALAEAGAVSIAASCALAVSAARLCVPVCVCIEKRVMLVSLAHP